MSHRASPSFERTRNALIASRRAFTLIELLVVIGLIVILVGGIGFSLGDTGGSSLASAQNTLASLCGAARAQAALHQTDARVVIYATRPPTGDAQKYLRLLQVMRRADNSATEVWLPVGDPVFLPRGVYVVPSSVTGLVGPGVSWPTNPPLLSGVADAGSPNQPAGSAFDGASRVHYVEFKGDGSVTQPAGQPYVRLVVATAAVANNLPQFNNPGAVRGVLLRGSGAVSFVHDANSF